MSESAARDSFPRVPHSRLGAGIRIGLVAGAATAGVIVGLGVRHESALRPFLLAGRATVAATTGLLAPPALGTLLGILIHAFWMVLWGVCFSIVATPLHGMQRIGAAIGIGSAAGLLMGTFLPGALGAVAFAVQTTPQTAFLLIVFAGSLLAGMSLARQSAREA